MATARGATQHSPPLDQSFVSKAPGVSTDPAAAGPLPVAEITGLSNEQSVNQLEVPSCLIPSFLLMSSS
jgi:hypothetical protein